MTRLKSPLDVTVPISRFDSDSAFIMNQPALHISPLILALFRADLGYEETAYILARNLASYERFLQRSNIIAYTFAETRASTS